MTTLQPTAMAEGMAEVITDQTPSRVSGYCSRFSRDLQEQGRLKEAEAGASRRTISGHKSKVCFQEWSPPSRTSEMGAKRFDRCGRMRHVRFRRLSCPIQTFPKCPTPAVRSAVRSSSTPEPKSDEVGGENDRRADRKDGSKTSMSCDPPERRAAKAHRIASPLP